VYKRLGSGSHAKAKSPGSDSYARPKRSKLDQTVPGSGTKHGYQTQDPWAWHYCQTQGAQVWQSMQDPSKQQTNREQLCTIVVRREKRNKKRKQLITRGNSIMTCLHAPHHVEEGMFAHLMIQRRAIFGHRKVSRAPP
jgi:hypothetical protein